VIEVMRKGQVEIKELCKSFGDSRQTLYRALEATDKASVEALTRKRRGRKAQPASEKQVKELQGEKKKLEKDLHRMSQRYEIAQTLLDLQRQAEQGKRLPGEKKNLRPADSADPKSLFTRRRPTRMARTDDGSSVGSEYGGSVPLAGSATNDADD